MVEQAAAVDSAGKIIAFNTRVARLRKESARVVLYKIDPDYHTTEGMGFIHPSAAIMLALFDGRRTRREVCDAMQYTFNLPDAGAAQTVVDETVKNLTTNFGEEILVDVSHNGNGRDLIRYNPLTFVIPADRINLDGSKLEWPLDLNYIVTQRCYRECIYCYAETTASPKFKMLSKERFGELMEEAGGYAVNTVTFSGGEAFYRKDILDLIGLAVEAKIFPNLSTKAYLSKRTCSILREMGIPYLQVSIDSHRPAVADFLAGSKGFTEQVLKTVRNLQACGIMVKVKAVVTPYNIFDMAGWMEYFYGEGITKFQIVRYGRSAFHHRDSLFVDNEELVECSTAIELFKQCHPGVRVDYNFRGIDGGKRPTSARNTNPTSFSNRAVCAVGRIGLTMLPDGRAFACEQLPTRDEFCFGDFTRQSIAEVWNSDALRNVIMPPREKFEGRACYACEEFATCHLDKGRCLRNAFILYGDAYEADPFCPRSPAAPRQE